MQPNDKPVHPDDTTRQKPTLHQEPNSGIKQQQNVAPLPAASPTTQPNSSQTDQPAQPATLSQRSVVAILISLAVAAAVGLFLVLLNELGKLPIWAKYIAFAIWTVALGIIAVWGIVMLMLPSSFRENFRQLIGSLPKKSKVISSVIVLAIFILAILGPFLLPSSASSPPTTPTGTPMPTPPSTNWKLVFQQKIPNCNNPSGVGWLVYLGGTQYSCSPSGGSMRQISSHTYAEMDLTQVKGGNYNQVHFQMLVQATFQNPADTSTWAAAMVQTPAAAGVPGGYIFTVSPTGDCQLQNVLSKQDIQIVERGSVTNFNPDKSFMISVIVQDGLLYGFVNGQQVLTHPDSLDASPRDVGLIVERQGVAPSSLVRFTNFKLEE